MRFLFKVLAQVEKPIVVGQDGKNGRRQLIPVPSGTVEGTDLQGNPITGIVLPGAVDSQVIHPDGKCELSARYGVQAEVRLYDRLFKDEAPDANPEGFLASLNDASLTVLKNAVVEPALAEAAPEFLCQFERLGYFVADRYDHSPEHPVFNRSVGLRDSWAKQNK